MFHMLNVLILKHYQCLVITVVQNTYSSVDFLIFCWAVFALHTILFKGIILVKMATTLTELLNFGHMLLEMKLFFCKTIITCHWYCLNSILRKYLKHKPNKFVNCLSLIALEKCNSCTNRCITNTILICWKMEANILFNYKEKLQNRVRFGKKNFV